MIRISKIWFKKYFTLTELLIVISILAILMSLLQPALKGVIFRAQMVKCQTNFKNIGMGLLLYSDDNYDLYPKGRYTSGGSKGQVADARTSFNGLTSLGFKQDVLEIMEPYYTSGGETKTQAGMNQGFHGSGKKSFESVFLCPQVDDEKVWPYVAGWGQFHSRRVPAYYSTYMPVQLYFNVRAHVGTAEVMTRVGDHWNWNTGYQKKWYKGPKSAIELNYRILAADILDGPWTQSYTITNHVQPGDINEYAQFQEAKGWRILNQVSFSSSYLFDDGSVKYYENIERRPSSTAPYLRFYNGSYVPVEKGENP
jgi:prepilin-type N-terminal cleavage/methylation domain-containing protein